MSQQTFEFGTVKSREPLTANEALRICEEASKARQLIANYPLDKTFRILKKLSDLWADPQYALRKRAKDILPKITNFSDSMIELGLSELSHMLNPDNIKKKLNTELGRAVQGTGFSWDPSTHTFTKWQPLGVVLHVLSGNVFLVGPSSWLEGVLTSNVTLLKMSSMETEFLPLFFQSLTEVDTDGVLSKTVALVNYASSQKDVMKIFKNNVDGLVVWGGEEAVQAYRHELPARTRVIVFGPKLSIAYVTEKGMEHYGANWVGERLAEELAVWDQNACTAPQMCFVEGEDNARKILEAAHEAFPRVNAKMKAGTPSPDTAVEIRKNRAVWEIHAVRNSGDLRTSEEPSLDWTLILDNDVALEPSPLHRSIKIVPVTSIDQLKESMNALRSYIQTVGVAAAHDEFLPLCDELGRCGVLRVIELGSMSGGEYDDPHDGQYDLPQLMNLVVHRRPMPPSWSVWDGLPLDEKMKWVNARFRELQDSAKKSEFYQQRLPTKTLDSVELLPQIPLLLREDLERSMPPVSRALETRPAHGGYVTRSGGSTGTPKFSHFDSSDWNRMVQHAVEVFRICGLSKGDRVANFMGAGDLYGGFLSFGDVCKTLGVTGFPFGGTFNKEDLPKIFSQFKVNVIIGVPSRLVEILKHVKNHDNEFTIDTVLFAGEPMSQANHLWLKENVKAKRILSIIGTTEAGQLAYQCTHQSQTQKHHLVDDYNWIEIVTESGQPVENGESGLIAITSLQKENYPLIRYVIGDSARFISEACACGRKDRVIEYLGRADDIISIGYMNLHMKDIRTALQTLPINDIQIVGRYGNAGKDEVILRIESESQSKELSQTVLETLDKIHDWKTGKGKYFDPIIEILKPGSLERNPRTGKVKALVDLRQQTKK